jgi:hypothetical protein
MRVKNLSKFNCVDNTTFNNVPFNVGDIVLDTYGDIAVVEEITGKGTCRITNRGEVYFTSITLADYESIILDNPEFMNEVEIPEEIMELLERGVDFDGMLNAVESLKNLKKVEELAITLNVDYAIDIVRQLVYTRYDTSEEEMEAVLALHKKYHLFDLQQLSYWWGEQDTTVDTTPTLGKEDVVDALPDFDGEDNFKPTLADNEYLLTYNPFNKSENPTTLHSIINTARVVGDTVYIESNKFDLGDNIFNYVTLVKGDTIDVKGSLYHWYKANTRHADKPLVLDTSLRYGEEVREYNSTYPIIILPKDDVVLYNFNWFKSE